MKILFVWITAVTLCFSITVGWYISQGIVVQIAHGALAGVTGSAASLVSLIEFANIIWGPLFDVLVILWAIVSSQGDDNISRMM
jgi:hypothetical protein